MPIDVESALAPEAAFATVLAFPFLAEPAYAYVDPSVMTYTIQALAGVAVALSAVAGVALRKTRKKLFALLKIDESARKEVEPDVHRVVDGLIVPNEARMLEMRSQPRPPCAPPPMAPHPWLRSDAPPWSGSASRGAAALAGAVRVRIRRVRVSAFTLLIVAPFELVAAHLFQPAAGA